MKKYFPIRSLVLFSSLIFCRDLVSSTKQCSWLKNACNDEIIFTTGTDYPDASLFLPLLKKYLPCNPTILEAGSYDGKDAITLANTWPAATIYSIEPVPELYAKTIKNVSSYPNIFTYSFALSDTNGTAPFVVSDEPSAPGIPSMSGSLLAPKEHLKHSITRFPYTIRVPTITLDKWGETFDIKNVDLLWLDLQGAELAVISTSKKLFKTVKAIVIELEFVEAYAKQPTLDQVDAFIRRNGFVRIARNFTQENVETFNNSRWFGDAAYVRSELYQEIKNQYH